MSRNGSGGFQRGGRPQGEVEGGGADFDIDQYTVFGTDVTKTALGPFTVIGIATVDSGDPAANLYIPLRQARTLADEKNKVTTIYVKATDSQRIDTVRSAIQENVSGTTVTTSSDLAKTGSPSTASRLGGGTGGGPGGGGSTRACATRSWTYSNAFGKKTG